MSKFGLVYYYKIIIKNGMLSRKYVIKSQAYILKLVPFAYLP